MRVRPYQWHHDGSGRPNRRVEVAGRGWRMSCACPGGEFPSELPRVITPRVRLRLLRLDKKLSVNPRICR